jgi:hypothetical protein
MRCIGKKRPIVAAAAAVSYYMDGGGLYKSPFQKNEGDTCYGHLINQMISIKTEEYFFTAFYSRYSSSVYIAPTYYSTVYMFYSSKVCVGLSQER